MFFQALEVAGSIVDQVGSFWVIDVKAIEHGSGDIGSMDLSQKQHTYSIVRPLILG